MEYPSGKSLVMIITTIENGRSSN